MKQLEERLIQLRSEYESGQKIQNDIENKLEELQKRKTDLKETLLRISGAIELLEEILEEEQQGKAEISRTEKTEEGSEEQNIEADIQTDIQADIQTDIQTGIEVPFVIRKPMEQARKIIEDHGLSVGEISEKNVFVGGLRFGDVVQQDPKPGTKVEKGSAVNLVLAAKGRFKPNLSKDSRLNAFMME